jgi:hypothetical protein
LDGGGQSHIMKYTPLERLCQMNLAARRFLCYLKSAVSAVELLYQHKRSPLL